MCLGGDNTQGVTQKPFQGQVDYDYIMWIDSDIVFTPDQLFKLIDNDKDIVSGLYKMQNNTHYATVEKWDDNFFLKHGSYEFLTPEMVSKKKGLFPVAYTGFGWMLMKKGVFESLEYPWFQPTWTPARGAREMAPPRLSRTSATSCLAFCLRRRGSSWR
jgi:glycosyltransferase involved in cell wall biosynthesis